jgi:hypothetical protein
MIVHKQNKEEKQKELVKYKDLVLAAIDYYLDLKEMLIKTADFDSIEHYQQLKIQTEEHFKKGRLTRLKQWFKDLIEMQVECGNLKFNQYLKDKTKYEIDIFKSYFQRVEKIIEKGKIRTDNQYYDINIMIDQLCQTEPMDIKKIDLLNKLITDYEQYKSQQTKKRHE